MKKIGLISDSHGHIDDSVISQLSKCDEIWHAGDIGSTKIIETLEKITLLKAVYGNIDNQKIRSMVPLNNRFMCENLDVWITHIGGYPGKYPNKIRKEIMKKPPQIFVCGHSHILRIMHDKKNNILCLNPGAIGKYGIHQVRTMLKFVVKKDKIDKMRVIEFKK